MPPYDGGMARRALVLLLMLAAFGAASDTPREVALSEFEAEALASRWAAAQACCSRWLQNNPADPEFLYNSACMSSRLDDPRQAASLVVRAINSGFRDFSWMAEDPDLSSARQHESWGAVITAQDAAMAEIGGRAGVVVAPRQAMAATSLANWKGSHSNRAYKYETLENERLFLSHDLDAQSAAELRSMLQAEGRLLSRMLFTATQPDWVFIAVTRTVDADGAFDAPSNTGAYDHGTRSLITRDSGASLRHEYVHALHFGHQQRLGQRHPIWILEGLASLFEDYQSAPDGSVKFLPNSRHNVAYKQVRSKQAKPWRVMCTMKFDTFMGDPLRYYPQARSMFEFIADRGLLERFYREYTAGWKSDSSGARALERSFGVPLAEIDAQWRAWLLARGAVDDVVEAGDGALGVTLAEEPDGARVTRVFGRSAADQAGLRVGDIIVGVGTRTVRSIAEAVEAVAAHHTGDRVEIRFRRRGAYQNVTVTLLPLRPN